MNDFSASNRTLILITDLLKENGWSRAGDQFPPLPVGPGDVLHPANPRLQGNYVNVRPRSLNELKLLIGVTNHCIDHSKGYIALPAISASGPPVRSDFEYAELDDDTRRSVDDAIYRVLFGPINEDEAPNGPLGPIVTYLMNRYEVIPVLVGDNLDVPSGTTYQISTPSAVFDTITIHGTGQIQLLQDCKLTANTVQHLDS